MRALERAITERVPVEGLASVSPLHGLRRRRIGPMDVAAQSFAAVAPAGVALMNPGTVSREAGPFALASVITTVLVVMLLAFVLSQFTRRIASAGSLYTFVVRGLGPRAGVVAGACLGVGYGSIAVVCLVDAAARVQRMSGGAVEVAVLVVVATAVLIAAVNALGVRISTRVLLIVEALAVITVSAIAVTVLIGSQGALADVRPVVGLDMHAVLAGVAVGLIAFVGFESGIALGPETRRPLASVTRALGWTVLAVSLSYLLAATAQLAGQAPFHESGEISEIAATGLGLHGLTAFVEVIIILSFLACALATTTALVRLLFVMSREGLVGDVFGRTGARGTPATGGALVAAAVGAVALAGAAVPAASDAVRHTADAAAILGYVSVYLLVAAAAPVFLMRIGEFRWASALPAFVVVLVLAMTLVHYVTAVPADRLVHVLFAIGVIALLAVLLMLRAQHRSAVLQRLGLYDLPVASDTIGGTPAVAVNQLPRADAEP
ncbi:APC family permease [Microbacterium sp. M]|uniref:APC family permease n=1 Tax=Microbacterium sp. M TaxID=3377125 RepID=UPI0038636A53